MRQFTPQFRLGLPVQAWHGMEVSLESFRGRGNLICSY